MSRRASLPGADELFRSTSDRQADNRSERRAEDDERPGKSGSVETGEDEPRASGRIAHDQKITVYLTSQELVDLEQARLRLRAEFDLSLDRGRIVREAISELLADLEDKGPDSTIVRRLS